MKPFKFLPCEHSLGRTTSMGRQVYACTCTIGQVHLLVYIYIYTYIYCIVQNSGGSLGKLDVICQYFIQLNFFDMVVDKIYIATFWHGDTEVLSSYEK